MVKNVFLMNSTSNIVFMLLLCNCQQLDHQKQKKIHFTYCEFCSELIEIGLSRGHAKSGRLPHLLATTPNQLHPTPLLTPPLSLAPAPAALEID